MKFVNYYVILKFTVKKIKNLVERNKGSCEILSKTETYGLNRKVMRGLKRKWCKEKKRTLPSPYAVFRYSCPIQVFCNIMLSSISPPGDKFPSFGGKLIICHSLEHLTF